MTQDDGDGYTRSRVRMLEDQLISRGISAPKVLEAFRIVPRHRFVPVSHAAESYMDHPLPIGPGQTISQPYIVALMTELLDLRGDEKVLEIGTGSGYQTAILAGLCRRVYTVERDAVLYERARKVLSEEGYENIEFKRGDGTEGWAQESPFDGIIVTAAAPDIPVTLTEQLADGGRIVIPVGPMYAQTLVLLRKEGGEFHATDVCGCVFVPLLGKHGWR